VVTDVTVQAQVQALIAATVEQFGRIDVMVNNSGLMAIAPMAQGRTDEWDRMIDINIKGVLYGIAAALPNMQQQNSGHIINIASVAGIKVFAPGGTVYSGTKYAVRAITEGLRMEVGGNIRTTLISRARWTRNSSTAARTRRRRIMSMSSTSRPSRRNPLHGRLPTRSNSPLKWTSTRSCCAPPFRSSEPVWPAAARLSRWPTCRSPWRPI
jgi:NADP-dependent 3-hydroxy acid dehydrogenase YdfG